MHTVCLGAALAACFAVLPSGAAAAVDVTAIEVEEVQLINDYRAQNGAPVLVIDAKLTAVADWMAGSMASNNYFSHTDNLGRDPFDRMAAFGYPANTWRGENLAAGNADAPSTFTQWRESPGHNENMLNANYRAVGISMVEDPASQYGHYWVTEFGSSVVERVPSPEERARLGKYTPAQRKHIRRVARQCGKLRKGSKAWKHKRCAWNLRTAKKLAAVGL